METGLSVETVGEFLRKNPEFLNNWLSSRGLSEIADERSRKPENAIGNAFLNYVQDIVQKKRVPQSKLIYNEVNKNDLFKELVRDIADELDVNVLCHKILQNVCILTRSDRGSLFLVRRSPTEQYLVSKLFDVTTTSGIDDNLHSHRDAIRIPFGEGIIGTVAETRKSINIKDAYKDPRFNKDIDMLTGYQTRCIMSLPIFGLDEEVVGVACAVNKLDGDYFTRADEQVFQDYLSFCGIGINNAQLFEIKVEEFKRNQLLLHLVKQITRELAHLKKLVEVILQQALNMLDCKRVSVYLIDTNFSSSLKFSHVFELSKDTSEVTDCIADQKFADLARKCIMTGEVMFTPTVYDIGKMANVEDLFFINIMNAGSVVIGCIIFDRDAKDVFSRTDVEMMETFALFCGIGVQNAQNYEVALKSEAQKQIALDVLANHCLATQEEADRLMSFETMSLEKLCIYQFDFNDMEFNSDETVLACAQLFLGVKALKLLNIPLDLLYIWILTVKKNYRSVIYHNWRHGLNVAQTMFCMLTTGEMNKVFPENDCLYLMVASLCHDLDHRGTNNAFQVKVASPLATLYSTSVMEHHHIDRCIMILNSDRTNIFKNLSAVEYKHAMKTVEHGILSTDLVLYFEKRNQFKHLVENGEKVFATDQQKDLLLSMMMTACDLSAITKPWKVQRKVALIVAREFYYQGDMEKELAESIIPLMDRDKRHDLPKMQVSFIDFVCVMVYKYLAEMNELLSPLYNGCLANRENWGNIATGKKQFNVDKRIQKQEETEDFFLSEFSEEEIDDEKELEEGGEKKEEEDKKKTGEEEDKKKEEEKKKVGEIKEDDKKNEEEEKKKKKEIEEQEEKKKKEEEERREEEKKKKEEEEKREEENRKKEEGEKKEEEKKKKEEDEKKKKEKDDEKKKEDEEKRKKEEEEKKKKKREEEEKKKKEEEEKKKKKEEEEKSKDKPSDVPQEVPLPLTSRRTYRQPSQMALQSRHSTVRTCIDDLAEVNQKKPESKRHTSEVKPLVIKRRSTVVLPPNPNHHPVLHPEDSNVSLETQKHRRLNDYASSSSVSEEEETTDAELRKPGRSGPLAAQSHDPAQTEIIEEEEEENVEEEEPEEEDEIPELPRRVTRRVTGPQPKYVANNDRPKKYLTK